VLVRVALAMRQHEARLDLALQPLKGLLGTGAVEGHEAVAEIEDLDVRLGGAVEKGGGAGARLGGADGIAGKHHPADRETRDLGGEAEDRAAAADLDVVRVRAETEQAE